MNQMLEMSYSNGEKVKTEITRKSIHMMVAFVPSFAQLNMSLTIALLAAASLAYSFAEMLRIRGYKVLLVSAITNAANRNSNRSLFVLGPVTLSLGAMLSLMLYPSPAATIAIYALAFGDGFSSLIGKLYGRVTIPFSGGKTFAGSFACLLAVFLSTYSVTGTLQSAAATAVLATSLELLPTGDLDNMVIPLGTGFFVSLFFL
jgi:phytol kinase